MRDHSSPRTAVAEERSDICRFPRNFYVYAEFSGIRYWPVISGRPTIGHVTDDAISDSLFVYLIINYFRNC